jgi:hypothetical protein
MVGIVGEGGRGCARAWMTEHGGAGGRGGGADGAPPFL